MNGWGPGWERPPHGAPPTHTAGAGGGAFLQADIQGCSFVASFSAAVFISLRHLTRPSDARHTRKCSFGDGAALCMGHLFVRGHHTSAHYLRTALPAEPGHLPTPTTTLTAGFPRDPGGPWPQDEPEAAIRTLLATARAVPSPSPLSLFPISVIV